MPRRYQEHRHHHSRTRSISLTSALRKPGAQIAFLLIVALVVFLILQMGARNNAALAQDISVGDGYKLYQNGAFVLDVREQNEWDEFHVPNSTLIPLGQLSARLNEVPHDRQIIVVCRTGRRSQQGRDTLLNAGFKQVTSMTGGLEQWRASGYPIAP